MQTPNILAGLDAHIPPTTTSVISIISYHADPIFHN